MGGEENRGAVADAFRKGLEAAHEAEAKRRAAGVSELHERLRPELERISKAVGEPEGPDAEALSQMIEAVGRHGSASPGEFAETLQRTYEPIIERAVESAGVDREKLAKEYARAIGVPEQATAPGRLLSAHAAAPGGVPSEREVPGRRRDPKQPRREG